MTKPTVLAVDDTPANLIALEAILQRDFDLVFANSGREAISLLETRSDIDVILMDLQMPNMDGFEAARRIKGIAGCKYIPIVFITAVFRNDPFVKRGYEVGGVDYFAKPFDPDLLRLKLSGKIMPLAQQGKVTSNRFRTTSRTPPSHPKNARACARHASRAVGEAGAWLAAYGRICPNAAVRRCSTRPRLSVEAQRQGGCLGRALSCAHRHCRT